MKVWLFVSASWPVGELACRRFDLLAITSPVTVIRRGRGCTRWPEVCIAIFYMSAAWSRCISKHVLLYIYYTLYNIISHSSILIHLLTSCITLSRFSLPRRTSAVLHRVLLHTIRSGYGCRPRPASWTARCRHNDHHIPMRTHRFFDR